MSGINEWLADYYGTGDTMVKEAAEAASQEDLELWGLFKEAAAEDGIDVDQLSDEDVDALAAHYLSEEAEEASPEEAGELPPNWDESDVENYNNLDDTEKTAFVQFKEAEFLGQVMAHSMFSEMDKMGSEVSPGVYKSPAEMSSKELAAFKASRQTAAGKPSKLKTRAAQAKRQKGQSTKAQRAAYTEAQAARGSKTKALLGKTKSQIVGVGRHLGKHKGLYAGGAALTALGAGLGRSTAKTADAIDAMAEQRALNFLKEAGVEIDDGYDTDDVIDQRAIEMLIESGYGELLE